MQGQSSWVEVTRRDKTRRRCMWEVGGRRRRRRGWEWVGVGCGGIGGRRSVRGGGGVGVGGRCGGGGGAGDRVWGGPEAAGLNPGGSAQPRPPCHKASLPRSTSLLRRQAAATAAGAAPELRPQSWSGVLRAAKPPRPASLIFEPMVSSDVPWPVTAVDEARW